MIRIPNSLYVPKLEKCLLLPQHWAQEARDNQTWMGNFAHCCILHWGKGFQKTIPFNLTSNTMTFFTASSSKAYCAFTSTNEATKPYSSAARPSSPSLGYSFREGRSSLILTSSSLRKICISRKTGDVRLTRTSPRMMKPSKCQTYLNGSQTC
jgi:hypothetical protein